MPEVGERPEAWAPTLSIEGATEGVAGGAGKGAEGGAGGGVAGGLSGRFPVIRKSADTPWRTEALTIQEGGIMPLVLAVEMDETPSPKASAREESLVAPVEARKRSRISSAFF
jgi:hypothetical protein